MCWIRKKTKKIPTIYPNWLNNCFFAAWALFSEIFIFLKLNLCPCIAGSWYTRFSWKSVLWVFFGCSLRILKKKMFETIPAHSTCVHSIKFTWMNLFIKENYLETTDIWPKPKMLYIKKFSNKISLVIFFFCFCCVLALFLKQLNSLHFFFFNKNINKILPLVFFVFFLSILFLCSILFLKIIK